MKPGEWQPISGADKTLPAMLMRHEWIWPIKGYWSDSWGAWCDHVTGEPCRAKPTHYLPLLECPEA